MYGLVRLGPAISIAAGAEGSPSRNEQQTGFAQPRRAGGSVAVVGNPRSCYAGIVWFS